jgi:uncharacterized LabA/DUF88 family protein
MAGRRSIIYVDGLNLYYGAVKGTPWRWLDLHRYFRLLRQDDDVQAIKYFTALVEGPHRAHQETYLLALATLPKVQVILGRFKTKQVRCQVQACNLPGPRVFLVPEEKRTDVNIAVHMVHDAVFDLCDRLVLVSGDSDLVPGVSMVRDLAPHKEVVVYVPARNRIRGAAVEIRSLADKDRTLPNALLSKNVYENLYNRIGQGLSRRIIKCVMAR